MTTTILFLRHGNTNPGENDLERTLTTAGEAQAEDCRRELENLMQYPDLVIQSPARRASSTADIVFPNRVATTGDHSLYAACYDPEMGGAYADLGPTAPPFAWIEKYPRLWQVCENYADESYWRIVHQCRSHNSIVVAGHGTLLNALAAKFVEDEQLKKLILSFAFPECGVVAIRYGKSLSFHI